LKTLLVMLTLPAKLSKSRTSPVYCIFPEALTARGAVKAVLALPKFEKVVEVIDMDWQGDVVEHVVMGLVMPVYLAFSY
jgi:hypothetical protein